MAQFLIERHFGQMTPEQVAAAGSESKRQAAENFPDITWERSHVMQGPDGLVTYCVYSAPDEEYVRKHAAAAGLPCDQIQQIAQTVGPGDFE
ncbi:MAG: DUF4242 domain-containing protein [Actinomycetota bacterium]